MPAPVFRLDLDQFQRFLRAKNLSVRHVSDYCGVSRTTFRRMKSGGGITHVTAARLAEVGIHQEILEVAK